MPRRMRPRLASVPWKMVALLENYHVTVDMMRTTKLKRPRGGWPDSWPLRNPGDRIPRPDTANPRPPHLRIAGPSWTGTADTAIPVERYSSRAIPGRRCGGGPHLELPSQRCVHAKDPAGPPCMYVTSCCAHEEMEAPRWRGEEYRGPPGLRLCREPYQAWVCWRACWRWSTSLLCPWGGEAISNHVYPNSNTTQWSYPEGKGSWEVVVGRECPLFSIYWRRDPKVIKISARGRRRTYRDPNHTQVCASISQRHRVRKWWQED